MCSACILTCSDCCMAVGREQHILEWRKLLNCAGIGQILQCAKEAGDLKMVILPTFSQFGTLH